MNLRPLGSSMQVFFVYNIIGSKPSLKVREKFVVVVVVVVVVIVVIVIHANEVTCC